MGALATAVRFLTRLPAPASRVVGLHEATGWFPFVGLLVGGLAAGVFWGGEALLGSGPAAVLAVAAAVVVTGAFHEDGLADTADGLWGGWDAARRLEIMRDSRVGTYGAAALVLTLGLRVALLAVLGPADALRALLMGHVLGRATTLPLVRWWPSARTDGATAGLAAGRPAPGGAAHRPAAEGRESVAAARAPVAEPPTPAAWGIAGITVAAVGGAALGVWAVPVLAAGLAAAVGLARTAHRRVGGITGDVLGAANQLAHLVAMAGVVALVRADVLGAFPLGGLR